MTTRDAKSAAAAAARDLLCRCYDGVLATVSVDVAGYPFGSVVPYCLDQHGRPLILIASIAQHTKNIRADARVSLTLFDRGEPDLQAAGRVTVLGDARRLGDDERALALRYYRYFPQSHDYDRTHDFAFYAITPRRIRYIGGFGAIHWFEPDSVVLANPFDADAERGIVEHMNVDHAAAIAHYCAVAGIEVPPGVTPEMVGCDAEGINLRLDARVARIAFDAPATDLQAVRQTLVAMARA
ncbi:MAG: HugZ family protein [Proteobacteria bacterium]|nr:HugZ family protein [Pseudomonadota bacterium]